MQPGDLLIYSGNPEVYLKRDVDGLVIPGFGEEVRIVPKTYGIYAKDLTEYLDPDMFGLIYVCEFCTYVICPLKPPAHETRRWTVL